jgi:methylmalonyl-CoA mutase, C-terminal domain
VFGGGIIPDDDAEELKEAGVARLFTPGAPLDEIVTWLDGALAERAASQA